MPKLKSTSRCAVRVNNRHSPIQQIVDRGGVLLVIEARLLELRLAHVRQQEGGVQRHRCLELFA